MYTTHGGIHLTSLYCNKEEIQFVKYHRTACISHQIDQVMGVGKAFCLHLSASILVQSP